MLSQSSLKNSKLMILKISLILGVNHIIKCYTGDYKCFNNEFLKNLLSILFGILSFNFIILKIYKNTLKIKNTKIYNLIKNILLFSSIILSTYFFNNKFEINNLLIVLTIMLMYNLLTIIFIKNKSEIASNLDLMKLVINSINLTLFIILYDIFILHSKFDKNMIKNYLISIIIHLIIK